MEMEEIPQGGVDQETLLTNNHGNNDNKIMVERLVYTQKNFDENYEPSSRPSETLKRIVKNKLSKCSCSGRCVRNFLFGVFPCIDIMRKYNVRMDLMGDVVSGLTVGIMHIPQGMAYGMLTTLPPVYGLYASFFPVLVYFLFGSSRHISMGTFAVACLMIGSTVTKGYDSVVGDRPLTVVTVASGNQSNTTGGEGTGGDSIMSPEELDIRLQFAMSVTFLVGIIQLLMSFFRLGFITVYLSDPLISGFTTGAACHVFTSQIKHVFGLKTARYSGAFKLIRTYIDLFGIIHKTNLATVLISVICMVILYTVSRFINQNPKLKPKMFMPVPIELIVVVLGTLISYLANFEDNFNVIVVDHIPTGLPAPSTHAVTRVSDVIGDAIALAIVVFAVSISMGKLLAKKHDYEVVANQELLAYGLCMVVSSFFSSVVSSASLSRSLIQERVGGKTQVAGLVSCCLLLVVLLAIGPYFRTLPNCVLASIIIVALRGMFLQVLDLKKLWEVSIIDFLIWIVAFLATTVLDVDLGLLAAVVFAICTTVYRSQRPYACVLGQIPNSDIYRDTNIYKEAQEVEGLKIYRFEQSLFFVNTEHFRSNLYKMIQNPRDLKKAREKRRRKLEQQRKQAGSSNDGEEANKAEMEMVLERSGEVKVSVIADGTCAADINFHTIIIDCSPWSYVDTMGVKVLSAVIEDYKDVGIHVCLANCKSGLREMFEKTKFYETLDHSNIYISVHDAVLHLQGPVPSQSSPQRQGSNSGVEEVTPALTDQGPDHTST